MLKLLFWHVQWVGTGDLPVLPSKRSIHLRSHRVQWPDGFLTFICWSFHHVGVGEHSCDISHARVLLYDNCEPILRYSVRSLRLHQEWLWYCLAVQELASADHNRRDSEQDNSVLRCLHRDMFWRPGALRKRRHDEGVLQQRLRIQGWSRYSLPALSGWDIFCHWCSHDLLCLCRRFCQLSWSFTVHRLYSDTSLHSRGNSTVCVNFFQCVLQLRAVLSTWSGLDVPRVSSWKLYTRRKTRILPNLSCRFLQSSRSQCLSAVHSWKEAEPGRHGSVRQLLIWNVPVNGRTVFM